MKTTRAHAGVNRGTLARVALTGGTPREVAENVNEVDWAPNGSFVFARDVDERGRLEHPPGKVLYETKGHVSSPRFSPRADLIAFADHPVPDDNRGAVAIVDLNGRKRTLTREFPALSKLAWSPSGDEIWFTASPAGGDLSLWGVTPGGRLRAIARMPASVYLEDVRHGRALMTRMNHRIAIRWLAPGDSRERDLTWFGQSIVTGLSEDGRTIVFQEMGEPAEPEYDVCLWRADGAPVKLGRGYSGNLSPDGKWVVSLDRSIKQGSPHVLLPTGPSEPRKVEVPGLINSILVDWFPDGKHLLAIGQKEERSPERLFVADLDGGAPRPLTPEGVVGQRAISADGLLVAVAGPDRQIRLYPVGGGAPRPVPAAVEGDTPVQWSPDGRWLYVQPKTGPGPVRVFRIDLRAGTRELWRESTLDDPLASKFRVHVSRDGNSYAYFYERWTSDLYVVDGLK